MGFSETNLQKKQLISWKNSGQISPKINGSKKPIARKFCGQILLESNWFCADFTNIFNETKRQFCQFFFWGGGVDWNNER